MPSENFSLFFRFDPAPYTQFRDPGVRPAPWGAFRLRGKAVVLFEAELPWFEPRTSSIRRGRCIHSAMPHPWLKNFLFVDFEWIDKLDCMQKKFSSEHGCRCAEKTQGLTFE